MQKGDLVAVFSLKDELVCLGIALLATEEIVRNEKGYAVQTSKVFLDPEVYPHFKKNVE